MKENNNKSRINKLKTKDTIQNNQLNKASSYKNKQKQ